ncbi:MAG: Zn-ribbon domain-containing OB-fold protein [Candidatus Heimdallarchaeota archaeon]|nr:Zn-ribbon domain-containing OB-fold protein [Candidatus Heimdallarchaeota archaeon]
MKFGHVSMEDYPRVVEVFSENLANNKLVGSECGACQKKYFPPRSSCENLHSDMQDLEISGAATLKAFTIIHFAPDSMANKAPYVVAIGELSDNISVMAHLVGITTKPKIGMSIQLKVQKLDEKRYVYKYVPA